MRNGSTATSLEMSGRSLQERDRVYIKTGPYKHATATVMRLTTQKMEVYLHDDQYNGRAVVLNQTSGIFIPKPYGDSILAVRTPEVKPPRRERNRAHTVSATPATKDQYSILVEEIDQMQSRLAMMKLVVTQLGEKNKGCKPPVYRG